MKHYVVTVKGFGRVSVQHVEATSEHEAMELAMDKARISVSVSERSPLVERLAEMEREQAAEAKKKRLAAMRKPQPRSPGEQASGNGERQRGRARHQTGG